jgi:osmoprotectant transport system substrate-binding protein
MRPGALAVRAVATALVIVVLGACASEEPGDDLVVGVGSTVEQQVLAALTVVALEHAGYAPEVVTDLGDTVGLRRQARTGAIDLYWDYTGAAWALGLGQENPPAEPLESYDRVREADLEHGLVWLEPTEANATLAFFVRAAALPSDPPNGMGWLAGKLSADEETLCVDDDFRRRPGGLPQLATEYYHMSLDRVQVVSADEREAIAGVAEERCFAGLATATAGEAYRAGLTPVADELRVFPAFVVAPVVREEALEREPGMADALAPVVERLDTAALGSLNARAADADPEELAREFLAGVLPDEN